MTKTAAVNIGLPPRSEKFKDKTVAAEGYVTIRGRSFYKRIFTDGCAELTRFDDKTEKQVFLCFPGEQAPNQLEKIKEAIKHNFDIAHIPVR